MRLAIGAVVKIFARSEQSRVAAFRRAALPQPQQSRAACVRDLPARKCRQPLAFRPFGRKTRLASGHCEKIGARVLNVLHAQLVNREAVGEFNRRLHDFGE